MKRLIVGLSGASGAIYGVRLLQVLRNVAEVETHLVMSQAARQTLSLETDLSLRDVQALADVVHDARDIAASISSGSFKTAGMVILPCSIKTLSGIVNSYTDTLVTRGGCGAEGASSSAVRAGNAAAPGPSALNDAGC
jgi:4-hydroxy-3-polyprenylbenzoate decarboxylase